MSRVVVSACLLGVRCRYDGCSRRTPGVAAALASHEVVAVCPEELGGLGTPRPPAHLVGGDGHDVLSGTAEVVRVVDGQPVTAAFLDGARRALTLSEGCTAAILKARSPSCGVGSTRVDGDLVSGDGVFAALLRQAGLQLRSEDDL
jgi:uncharacterized protein YbbK (DUF523 family)